MYSCLKSISDQCQCQHICITLSNRIIVSSTEWSRLTHAEQHILTYLIALNDYSNDILPTVRDMPVYLDSIDRTHNYRLLSIRLLGQIYVSILCLSTPKMSEFESLVEKYSRPHIELIQNLNALLYPRAFQEQILFDQNIRALLYCNHQTHFCVSTLEPHRSNANILSTTKKKQRYFYLRQFVLEILRMNQEKLVKFDGDENEIKMNEMSMINEIESKCYYLRENDFFELFILFDSHIPSIAMRGVAKKTLGLLRKHL